MLKHNLRDKVVVVTGAAGAIGRALCHESGRARLSAGTAGPAAAAVGGAGR